MIADLYYRLNSWYKELPSHLRCDAASSDRVLPPVIMMQYLSLSVNKLMESMMYHTTTILLFRPFGSQKQIAGIPASPWELCTASANSIVTLIKLYRSRYSLRYIVNLSVHMIFTASIIHLVNATSSNDSLRRSSNNALRTCTSAFVEIGKVWPSASKSLRVVESLQQKWQIHTSSQPIDDDVSAQNWTNANNYTYPTLPMKVEPEFDMVMPSFTDGEFGDTYKSSKEVSNRGQTRWIAAVFHAFATDYTASGRSAEWIQ